MLSYASASASTTQLQSQNQALKKQLIYRDFLEECQALIQKLGLKPRIAFISYAWENDKVANEALQGWLARLVQDLKKVNIHVVLDVQGLTGEMRPWMQRHIENSDYIFVIGTPRYRSRAEQETNVAFEWGCIQAKVARAEVRDCLVPLLYSGNFGEAFPASALELLIRDFRDSEQHETLILGLSKPLGIIPHCYPELMEDNSYRLLVQRFELQLERERFGAATHPVLVEQPSTADTAYLPSMDYIKKVLSIDSFDAGAENQRGEQYYLGLNFEAAVSCFQGAAAAGHSEAQYNLGVCYYYGQGVPQDYGQAVHYYRLAALQGHTDAQNNLGNCYQKGKGPVAKNVSEAKIWFERAARQGYARAQFNLGACYQAETNYVQALSYYRQAAEQGHAGAQLYLGLLYEKGWGTSIDFQEALKWYQQANVQHYQDNQQNAQDRLQKLCQRAGWSSLSIVEALPIASTAPVATRDLESLQSLLLDLKRTQTFVEQILSSPEDLPRPEPSSYTPGFTDYRQGTRSAALKTALGNAAPSPSDDRKGPGFKN